MLEHDVFAFRISLPKDPQCGLLLFQHVYQIPFGRVLKN